MQSSEIRPGRKVKVRVNTTQYHGSQLKQGDVGTVITLPSLALTFRAVFPGKGKFTLKPHEVDPA